MTQSEDNTVLKRTEESNGALKKKFTMIIAHKIIGFSDNDVSQHCPFSVPATQQMFEWHSRLCEIYFLGAASLSKPGGQSKSNKVESTN